MDDASIQQLAELIRNYFHRTEGRGKNCVVEPELIDFHDGKYSLDGTMVRQLVDSATTGDKRYTPSDIKREKRKLDTQAMYESWQKAYRELRKMRPGMSGVWYSKQIAIMLKYNRGTV